MNRTILNDMTGVPAHLMTTVATAFACGLQPSLWEVRDLKVVHVLRRGEWSIFMPTERDSDALEVFARIATRENCAVLSNTMESATCDFGYATRATARYVQYSNDAGAALRAAIVLSATKLYKLRCKDEVLN